MNNELTMKDIENAMEALKCPKCKTARDGYIVLGYEGMYCKCQAEMLGKTNHAQQEADNVRTLLNEVAKSG